MQLDNSSKLGSTQKINKVNSEDSTIYILKLVSLRLVTLLKIYHIRYICNYAWILICVFVFVYFHMYLYFIHSGTLRSSYHYLLKNICSTCHVYLHLTNAVFAYLCICICVYVFVYLQVRHPGILFLRSSCHYLFKNIAHVMSICNFDQCCICLFVYLCICKSDTREHCFWGPLTITFSKI